MTIPTLGKVRTYSAVMFGGLCSALILVSSVSWCSNSDRTIRHIPISLGGVAGSYHPENGTMHFEVSPVVEEDAFKAAANHLPVSLASGFTISGRGPYNSRRKTVSASVTITNTTHQTSPVNYYDVRFVLESLTPPGAKMFNDTILRDPEGLTGSTGSFGQQLIYGTIGPGQSRTRMWTFDISTTNSFTFTGEILARPGIRLDLVEPPAMSAPTEALPYTTFPMAIRGDGFISGDGIRQAFEVDFYKTTNSTSTPDAVKYLNSAEIVDATSLIFILPTVFSNPATANSMIATYHLVVRGCVGGSLSPGPDGDCAGGHIYSDRLKSQFKFTATPAAVEGDLCSGSLFPACNFTSPADCSVPSGAYTCTLSSAVVAGAQTFTLLPGVVIYLMGSQSLTFPSGSNVISDGGSDPVIWTSNWTSLCGSAPCTVGPSKPDANYGSLVLNGNATLKKNLIFFMGMKGGNGAIQVGATSSGLLLTDSILAESGGLGLVAQTGSGTNSSLSSASPGCTGNTFTRLGSDSTTDFPASMRIANAVQFRSFFSSEGQADERDYLLHSGNVFRSDNAVSGVQIRGTSGSTSLTMNGATHALVSQGIPTSSGVPYHVSMNVSVSGGSSGGSATILQVNPGTVLRFENGKTLTVGANGSTGGLLAIGNPMDVTPPGGLSTQNPEQLIVFDGSDGSSGSWGGVIFTALKPGGGATSAKLGNVLIAHAGTASGGTAPLQLGYGPNFLPVTLVLFDTHISSSVSGVTECIRRIHSDPVVDSDGTTPILCTTGGCNGGNILNCNGGMIAKSFRMP